MKNDTYIGIRTALAQIIKGTEWEGKVFLVGGCVRDEIMQQEIHDVDIAVALPNGGIRFACWLNKKRLTARKPILFEHFGTAKFRLKSFPNEEIDSVQTRKGRYVYEEEPHPLENFGTIEEDAGCRDLTINSLYYNISTKDLLDPTGLALADIENHIIRTPNIPDISLRDNAMHILRCIRFAVKYNWRLSDDLLESMKRNVDIVGEATQRRMTKEVISIMALKHRKTAFSLIRKVGAWDFVEPFVIKVQCMKSRRRKKEKRKARERKQREGLKETNSPK